MSDMYADVREDEQRKPRRESWIIPLLAAIVILAVIAVVVVHPLICYYVVYPKFTASLLDSEYYAYENDCLRAEIDGKSIHIGKENIGDVCVRVILNPPDQVGFAAPDRAADYVLDFGDGSVLRLWTDTLLGGTENKAVRFLYEGADGTCYNFLTDNTNVENLSMPAQAFQAGNTALD